MFTLARMMAAAAEGGAMAEAAAQADQELRAAVTGETLVLLQARRDFAAGAAAGDVDAMVAAYLIIRDVAQNCNIGTVWAAERSARDVVVLHLREGESLDAHGIFVERAEAAFGDAWSRELRAILLVAYHKLNRPLK